MLKSATLETEDLKAVGGGVLTSTVLPATSAMVSHTLEFDGLLPGLVYDKTSNALKDSCEELDWYF
jgi:hypothetical protein